MGRRNTAIKTCHRCKKLVPTATRYCRCGYDFKKPTPSKAGTSAPTPPSPAASKAPVADSSRRKSERRQRITVKPDFYSPSDYENPFKKVRRRTVSDTCMGEDNVRRKRGRPRERLATGFVKPSISKPPLSHSTSSTLVAADSPGTPSADSKDSSKRDKDQDHVDMYTSLPPEKQLQFTILLAEINRKFAGQVFRPT